MSPAASTSAGSPSIPKISFNEPFENRRLSSNSRLSKGSSGAIDDDDSDSDHAQDWSVKVPDEETWAAKERRRSSVWNKVSNYPSSKPKTPTGSFSSSQKAGSILSLWVHGKDKHGNDVLHSGDNTEHWDGDAEEIERIEREKREERERVKKMKLDRIKEIQEQADRMQKEADALRLEALELDKAEVEVVQVEVVEPPVLDKGLKPRRNSGNRKGSVLGIWKGGKDEHGNDVIHSG